MDARKKIFNAFLEKRLVTTDSRNIASGSLFFALKGENFNGNAFATHALAQGAAYAIVDKVFNEGSFDERLIVVDDALKALQDLAADYRNTFQFPVLAITGSNGKTTTKELIREVIARKFKVYATEGNLNNHIGVPLTILRVPSDCEFAIIEMGANHQKEIASYCEIASPDFGLITNIGKAHLEGFGGVEGIIKGKGELFDSLRANKKMGFVNIELPHLANMIQTMNHVAYGFNTDPFRIEIMKEAPTLDFRFSVNAGETYTRCLTQLAGTYNLFNMASAIAIGNYFQIEEKEISDAISDYNPTNNRSQLWESGNNCVILDAYNANPSSMEVALRNLVHFDNPFFILGDMFEMGEYCFQEHERIVALTKELKLNGYFVGEFFKQVCAESFLTTADLRDFVSENPIRNKTLLLKGSRGMRLEQLKDLL
jgi:UDP-N-acetylmuramoyl-tripeptide--D-alanyl-D-alanine ligase